VLACHEAQVGFEELEIGEDAREHQEHSDGERDTHGGDEQSVCGSAGEW
jgi:hypothetical protein